MAPPQAPSKRKSTPIITGKILRWGNSYGVRISGKELKEANLAPGKEINLRILEPEGPLDIKGAPFFSSGHSDTARRHDEILAELITDMTTDPPSGFWSEE